MKTIQGKVLFGVMPVFNEIFKEKGIIDTEMIIDDMFPTKPCLLSSITEQQASGLVEPYITVKTKQCDTIMRNGISHKAALFALLRENGCFMPSMKMFSRMFDFKYISTGIWSHDSENEINTPDDWLVVVLNNTPPTPK